MGDLSFVPKNLRGLALGKLSAVKIDAHLDATIGGACERLQDWPVSQHIGCHVDFVLGAINQCNVDMFEVFCRRVVNDRRWIGAARRGDQRDEDGCGQESAKQIQH
jgi:hypothetical protein